MLLSLQLRNKGLNFKPLILGQFVWIQSQLVDDEMPELAVKQLSLLQARSSLLLGLQLLPVMLLPLQLLILLITQCHLKVVSLCPLMSQQLQQKEVFLRVRVGLSKVLMHPLQINHVGSNDLLSLTSHLGVNLFGSGLLINL